MRRSVNGLDRQAPLEQTFVRALSSFAHWRFLGFEKPDPGNPAPRASCPDARTARPEDRDEPHGQRFHAAPKERRRDALQNMSAKPRGVNLVGGPEIRGSLDERREFRTRKSR
jgi:hypothetical protein